MNLEQIASKLEQLKTQFKSKEVDSEFIRQLQELERELNCHLRKQSTTPKANTGDG
jgi:hypothetical protein